MNPYYQEKPSFSGTITVREQDILPSLGSSCYYQWIQLEGYAIALALR